MSIFDPKGTFDANVAALEAALGHKVDDTPVKLVRLTKRFGQVMDLRAEPGKFVSCALMQYLAIVAGRREAFEIYESVHTSETMHKIVREFFGPIWDEPGHATIDFLRYQETTVNVEIVEYEARGVQIEIEQAWEMRASIGPGTIGPVRRAVEEVLKLLDRGGYRVAEKVDGTWQVNQWLKKAVLLSFRLNDNQLIEGGPGGATWWDKVPSKFDGWDEAGWRQAGFRAVPGSVVRRSAFIAPGVVLMPSFVNVGAFVDRGTMVDTWATVGSCAQIGKNCHISGGVGIGGVLEPLQAGPVIIEDDCFIGARSEVVEGVIVGQGAVLSMGCFIGASTPIVDRATGEITYGRIPAYSVVIPGSMPMDRHELREEPRIGVRVDEPRVPRITGLHKPCVIIVKTVDAQTRAKTEINDLLRD